MLNVKFEVNDDLLRVLRTAENILSYNKTETSLKYLNLTNDKGKLKIIARNPFMRLEYIVEGASDINGDSALYENKTLIPLLRVAKGDITINDGLIKCSGCKYKIPCMDSKDYPDDVLPEITNFDNLDAEQFKQAIDNALVATDKTTSAVLSGVYIGDDKVIGCDSKRIIMQKIGNIEHIKNVVLSKEVIREIPNLPFKDVIKASVFGGNIILKDENITLCSALLSEKYPKVEQLMPKELKDTVLIKKDSLYNALVMVSPILDDETKECILEYTDSEMQITSVNGADEAKIKINIEAEQPIDNPIEVKFNMQFLSDMAKISGENITMESYKDNIGYMFNSGEVKQYIMPLIN
jgi:DNA polymerase III sliding clamp (beta) subunit (PCNA family)